MKILKIVILYAFFIVFIFIIFFYINNKDAVVAYNNIKFKIGDNFIDKCNLYDYLYENKINKNSLKTEINIYINLSANCSECINNFDTYNFIYKLLNGKNINFLWNDKIDEKYNKDNILNRCYFIEKNTTITNLMPFYIITDKDGVIDFLSINFNNFIYKILDISILKNIMSKNLNILFKNKEIEIKNYVEIDFYMNNVKVNKNIEYIIKLLINI
ncbi:MAG: hypothetical protein K0S55_962 [Clostridia bacterium]|nr:hypothetical protein [Clostridia bacterium]